MTIEDLEIKIIKYPDGTSYVELPRGGYQKDFSRLVYRINTYEDLWNLVQLVDVLNFNDIIPTITIPNLIDAQADRRFSEYESSGLKLVCRLLNSLNANFRIFHPHNPEVVEALINNVDIFDNSTLIEEVLENLT